MKVRKLVLGLVLLSAMLTSACSDTHPADTNQIKDLGELYSLAFDEFMPIDEGLNGGMNYIAIDMSNVPDLGAEDKKQILKYFEKYGVEVLEATYQQLIDKGLYDPQTTVLHGVLLQVEKAVISDQQAVIDGAKYRSGNGAIGMKVIAQYKDGKWQITKAHGTWIS